MVTELSSPSSFSSRNFTVDSLINCDINSSEEHKNGLVHLSPNLSQAAEAGTVEIEDVEEKNRLDKGGFSKASVPIRQTLSYFDVIFPHIQMMCNASNSSPASSKEGNRCSSSTEQKAAVGDWSTQSDMLMDIFQNSFANPTPSISGGLYNGFFFQQMQKTKRIRTAFSPSQLIQLEKAFLLNHYVIGSERKQLARKLLLSETQVKVWFQNRRTKQKRCRSEQGDDHLNG